MADRPFCLLPESTMATAKAQFATALARWQADWGLDCAFAVDVMEASGAACLPRHEVQWHVAVTLGEGTLWFGWNATMARALGAALFPPDRAEDPDAASVAASAGPACLHGLPTVFCALAGACEAMGAPTQPPPALACPGSGALVIRAAHGEGLLQIMLDKGVGRSLAPPTPAAALPALAPVVPNRLFDGFPVTLQFGLGTAGLPLGELLELAVGDVIALDANVDEPIPVTLTGGELICRARMRRNGERIVLAVNV